MTEGRADLHVHSNNGDGMLTVEQILEQAERIGLTAIALTDHDNVVPSLAGRELAAQRRLSLQVVTGAEVTTKGFPHLLALNIEENLPFGLPLFSAIKKIHRQGGLVVAAHPLVPFWPASLRQKQILSVLVCPDTEVYFDGFEVLNGSVKSQRAQGFYNQYLSDSCAAIAGSDAHFQTLGKAVTIYPPELGIVAAIKEKRTSVRDMQLADQLTVAHILLNLYRSMVKEPIRRGRFI